VTPRKSNGFGVEAFDFFRELAANQDRAWFQAHKEIYEREVLAKLRALLADVATELARRNIPLTADPIKAVFRIHRDVRFSRDKSPYKTHAGAVLTRDGEAKWRRGSVYIHVDPNGSFVAGGFYQPEPLQLGAIRGAILADPARFRKIEAGLHAAGLELSRGESLSRMPRGFEPAADSDVSWALRLRNFFVETPVRQAALRRPVVVGEIADFTAAVLPLLRFGWEAIS
jgi:uncharacterized protein (TIGR02453 family)